MARRTAEAAIEACSWPRGLVVTLVVAGLAFGPSCGSGGPGHPEGVGNACDEDRDCPTGTCYLGPGGGYCTAPCTDEGSTDQCPIDTVCKPIQGGARRCLLVCGTEHYCPPGVDCYDDWCPLGSSCVTVSHTTLRGCEPDPR